MTTSSRKPSIDSGGSYSLTRVGNTRSMLQCRFDCRRPRHGDLATAGPRQMNLVGPVTADAGAVGQRGVELDVGRDEELQGRKSTRVTGSPGQQHRLPEMSSIP